MVYDTTDAEQSDGRSSRSSDRPTRFSDSERRELRELLKSDDLFDLFYEIAVQDFGPDAAAGFFSGIPSWMRTQDAVAEDTGSEP